jgi:hypothetical protein
MAKSTQTRAESGEHAAVGAERGGAAVFSTWCWYERYSPQAQALPAGAGSLLPDFLKQKTKTTHVNGLYVCN